MLTIERYVKARNLEEAYELNRKKSSVVLGGMLWLKMQNRPVGTAIDLCELGLDSIEETATEYRIGAMVSLRTLETHTGLNELTQGAAADSVRHIVGVQFRNCATVGGSIYGRFGFSDVLTMFLALGAEVELYHAGRLTLEAFLARPRSERDLLLWVCVPKTPLRAVYLSQRNISTDFPVLTCALVHREGAYTCAIGARPMPAILLQDDNGCLSKGVTEESARMFAADIASRTPLGGNMRAGKEYRQVICEVLARRAALALGEE